MTTSTKPPLLDRLLKLGLILALSLLVLAFPAAVIIDKTSAVELVTLGSASPPDLVAFNQETFVEDHGETLTPEQRESLRDEIAGIYGVGASEPITYVFVDESRILHAKEDPSLAMLVKASNDERFLQLQTVYWLAKMLTLGAIGGALACLGLGYALRRRRARKQQEAGIPAIDLEEAKNALS